MRRSDKNPILTRKDVPEITEELTDVSALFNPGVAMIDGKIILLLRAQTRGGKTYLLKAFSEDGENFKIENDFILFIFPDEISDDVSQVLDPRITIIDNTFYVVCKVETESESKLWITSTKDFEEFKEIGFVLDFPASNGVLFPEKINDKFAMLFKPETTAQIEEEGIYIAYSEDLMFWNDPKLVAMGNKRSWDEIICPGTPPFKTKKGWVHFYKGVNKRRNSVPLSQIGALVLNLTDPSVVDSRTQMNILEPREMYEAVGRSPNIISPSGVIVKETDEKNFAKENTEIYLYYGAAETSVALFRIKLNELFHSVASVKEE